MNKKEEQRIEALRLRKDERLSLSEIVDRLQVSKSSVSTWVRDYPLTRAEQRRKSLEGQKRRTIPLTFQKKHPCRYGDISTVKKGTAAELFFNMQCLLRGIDCYAPTTEDGKIDFLVGSNFKRVQVKVIGSTNGMMPMQKSGCNSKNNVKKYTYSPDDIDFMVGVYLETLTIFICPIETIKDYKSGLTISAMEQFGFEEAFHYFDQEGGI